MLKKNDIIDLEIDACTAQGSGVGRYDGLAVFVPMTAKGDRIDAHILKVKSSCAFAKISSIKQASPDRVESDCKAYEKCGGCVFRHINYKAEAEIKENFVKDCLKRIGHIDIPVEPIIAPSGRDAYRNKAQFPLSQTDDGLKIGFFSQHSHRVVDCRDCALQPKEFETILNAFEKYIRKFNVSVYDEMAHTGLLRHIYIRKAEASGEIMVCAVINGRALPAEKSLVEILLDSCRSISSIIVNINKEKTNVILGKKCHTIYGSDYITDELCGCRFRISPLSFYQVNRSQAQKLYAKAAEYASLNSRQTVLDLYCGAGTIGLTMADRVKQIIGVEIVPEAIEDAKINTQLNNIENARFICADASNAAQRLKTEGIKPDTVILDPPRKGCAKDLLETVAQMAPEKIVYISCDPATQARDTAILTELGYNAEKACPVDMFPGTGHVESVVKMVKSEPSKMP